MKRIVVLALILALVVSIGSFHIALADSVQYITVTATGSEVDFTCNVTAWAVGTVSASETVATGFDWAEIDCTGMSEDLDITIAGRSMENAAGDRVWTLANDGSPGSEIFAIKGGLADNYTIIVKNVGESLNNLFNELSPGTDTFGLQFYAPTSTLGNEEMEMIGAGGTAADDPRGLVLTGGID